MSDKPVLDSFMMQDDMKLERRRIELLRLIDTTYDNSGDVSKINPDILGQYNNIMKHLERVNSTQTAKTTIDDLPDEILLAIFREAQWFDVYRVPARVNLFLGNACSRWSTILFNTPLMWTSLSIANNIPDLQATIAIGLHFSGQLELSLTHYHGDESLLQILPILQPHLHRITLVTKYWYMQTVDEDWAILTLTFPSVTSVEFRSLDCLRPLLPQFLSRHQALSSCGIADSIGGGCRVFVLEIENSRITGLEVDLDSLMDTSAVMRWTESQESLLRVSIRCRKTHMDDSTLKENINRTIEDMSDGMLASMARVNLPRNAIGNRHATCFPFSINYSQPLDGGRHDRH